MPYQQKFGLREHPFRGHPDPRFFYLANQHQSVIDKSKFVADHKLGLGVTYGSPGTGKTTLSRILFQRFVDAGKYETVLLADPGYKTDNRFLRSIIQEFGVGETQKAMQDSLKIFEGYLEQKLVKEGKTCLLIVDHGENMKEELYALLNDLLELKSPAGEPLLQVLVFGRHIMRDLLQDTRSKDIHEKIAITSSLEPLTFDDLARKVKFRLHVAGMDNHPFSDAALNELYITSRGNPRAAVRLADAAMHQALLSNQDIVDLPLIKAAESSLGLHPSQLALRDNEAPALRKTGKRGRPPKARK